MGHHSANPEATRRRYELIAREVVPAVNDANRRRAESLDFAQAKSGTPIPGLMNAVEKAIVDHGTERAERGGRGTAGTSDSED